jgi:hypothetical protein
MMSFVRGFRSASLDAGPLGLGILLITGEIRFANGLPLALHLLAPALPIG